MRVSVLMFARPRELAGTDHLELDLPEGASAADAFEAVAARVPGLAGMRRAIRCAIDGEFAGWDEALADGAEMALIPPTAGG